MNPTKPHFLLFSETGDHPQPGHWRFILRAAGTLDEIDVADAEPDIEGERLELLTVVRALESLDQPSRVTLMSSHPYVRHGIRYGLAEWRGNGWQWESFGQMVPVKHSDLWQRIDRAMRFHQIDFSRRRFDGPHRQPAEAEQPAAEQPATPPPAGDAAKAAASVHTQPTPAAELPGGIRWLVKTAGRWVGRLSPVAMLSSRAA